MKFVHTTPKDLLKHIRDIAGDEVGERAAKLADYISTRPDEELVEVFGLDTEQKLTKFKNGINTGKSRRAQLLTYKVL